MHLAHRLLLKITIQSAYRKIRAVQSTELERKYLQIDEKMPIFEVAQVAFTNEDKPFKYSVSHHRGEVLRFNAMR